MKAELLVNQFTKTLTWIDPPVTVSDSVSARSDLHGSLRPVVPARLFMLSQLARVLVLT